VRVSDSRGLRSDFVSIAQVVVFDRLEVFIELIHQRYAGRDVQFKEKKKRVIAHAFLFLAIAGLTRTQPTMAKYRLAAARFNRICQLAQDGLGIFPADAGVYG
jgi:hypothetical protein